LGSLRYKYLQYFSWESSVPQRIHMSLAKGRGEGGLQTPTFFQHSVQSLLAFKKRNGKDIVGHIQMRTGKEKQ
jgi:hypothetical protein